MELAEKKMNGEEKKYLLHKSNISFKKRFKLLSRLLVIFLNILVHTINAQEIDNNEKLSYFGNIELTYLQSIGKIKFNQVDLVHNTKMYGLRLSGGKMITQNLGFGIGIGLDGYHNFNYNTMPIFIDTKIIEPFRITKLNYSLKLGKSFKAQTFKEGVFMENTLSVDIRPLKRLLMNIGLSLKFQQIKEPEITYIEIDPDTNTFNSFFLNDNTFINSFGINVGFKF
uniref:hypothetical protein n=1 Tax=Roseivirga sp. TaxID=1964215 RepID=UPI004047A309